MLWCIIQYLILQILGKYTARYGLEMQHLMGLSRYETAAVILTAERSRARFSQIHTRLKTPDSVTTVNCLTTTCSFNSTAKQLKEQRPQKKNISTGLNSIKNSLGKGFPVSSMRSIQDKNNIVFLHWFIYSTVFNPCHSSICPQELGSSWWYTAVHQQCCSGSSPERKTGRGRLH